MKQLDKQAMQQVSGGAPFPPSDRIPPPQYPSPYSYPDLLPPSTPPQYPESQPTPDPGLWPRRAPELF
jgi:hypothetical protein